MNYRKVFWGAILVIIGVLLVLRNLNIIDVSLHSLWHMWPVVIILWGVALLPIKDYIKLVVSLILIVLAFVFLYKKADDNHWNWRWNWDDDSNTASLSNQNLSEPMDSTSKVAVLNFDAAAGAFYIGDTSKQLVEFIRKGEMGNYSMEVQQKGDTALVDLNMRDSHIKGGDHSGNEVKIKLNTKPVWDFEMNVGAASVEMDLAKYKTHKITMDGGACSIDLKVGNLQDLIELNLETGASSINVKVPKESGCEVECTSVLSSRNLEGFIKNPDGKYVTSNYNSSTKKIKITLDSAVSSITVERY